MSRMTIDFSDDLTGDDQTELLDASIEDGRSIGKLLKDAALSIVQARRERRALVSKDGMALAVTEQG